MSDFTNGFWDYYIAIISLVSVIGCAVVLKMQDRHKLKVTLDANGDPETTGHVWDGDLREFHNPMPRWWILLFYLTVVFSIVYLVLYPGLGTQWKGVLNWTQTGQYQNEVKAADARFGPIFAAFAAQPIEQVAFDPKAQAIGQSLFLNNCAQCHGSDARGSRGFPNLTDSEWMYGGTPEAIKTTILGGRNGVMPPMGEALGGKEDVADMANYVLSLSNSAHDPVRAIRGKSKFAACGACHGFDGKGSTAMGAPDLTNKIWLWGGTATTISETITNGRNNVMPKHDAILTPEQAHLVAAYVWSLTNKKSGAPPPNPGK
jgi:cytochrome c oxidase cbb3-type subunit 3